jgi:hypothetical protein
VTAADATPKGKVGDPFSSPWRRRLPLLGAGPRVRSQPASTSTLIGARTIDQFRSNLASQENTLAPEQLAALEESRRHRRSTSQPPTTPGSGRCGYKECVCTVDFGGYSAPMTLKF